MMKIYRITTKTIDEVLHYSPIPLHNNTLKEPDFLKADLNRLIKGENGVIDGELLRNVIFPTKVFEIFISHSHDDLEIAKKFALWLKCKLRYDVFLDSFVWGSSDDLLQEIDELYCKQKDGLYNYRSRNYSTAHVHTLLSMSIMEIIKRSKVGILIDSHHSINLESLRNSNQAKTLSPWIYQEIMFMRQFATNRSSTRVFSSKNLNEDLQIAHSVDLSGFKTLTARYLINREPLF